MRETRTGRRGAWGRGARVGVAVVSAVVLALSGGVAAVAAVSPDQGPETGGTIVTIDVPTAAYSQVAAGNRHSVAVTADGTVWAWGRNIFGQLGDGTTTDTDVPVGVQQTWQEGDTDRIITQVAAGQRHSLAVASDGTVWAWGSDEFGQLGNGTEPDDSSVPVQVQPTWNDGTNTRTITQVSAGSLHSLAIASDGTVWAWGNNDSGELGNGPDPAASGVPVQVEPIWTYDDDPDRVITQVAAGQRYSLALASDGTVWAWGNNDSGKLGDGTGVDTDVAVRVQQIWQGSDPDRMISQVAAGGNHSLAVASDGTVWTWGNNTYGQLGDGSADGSDVPVPVDPAWGVDASTRTITQVSAGVDFSLVVASDGTVWAWGRNELGQLGNGAITSGATSVPGQVAAENLAGHSITRVIAGGNHSLVVASDGTVWAWGYNEFGQLGDGTTTDRWEPVMTVAPVVVSGVSFGGVAGTGLTQPSATEVTVLAPAHAPGVVDVVINTLTQAGTPGPTTTLTAGYTYTQATYPFTGFFAPVDNGGVINMVKAGSAVPVKFSLAGDQGLDIFATPGTPVFTITTCGAGAVDEIETVTAASVSGLKYDPVTKAYTYTWKTPKTLAGKCGIFSLNLEDGSTHTAKFQLR